MWKKCNNTYQTWILQDLSGNFCAKLFLGKGDEPEPNHLDLLKTRLWSCPTWELNWDGEDGENGKQASGNTLSGKNEVLLQVGFHGAEKHFFLLQRLLWDGADLVF